MKRNLLVLALGAVLYAGLNRMVHADGTTSHEMKNNNSSVSELVVSLYDQGIAAGKSNDDKKAVDLFQQAAQTDPNNADVLNQLAHAQRKIGQLDDAIENYGKALKIRPDFPEAREYLGEAYLQEAVKEAELLKGYGEKGQEELEDLSKDFQEAEKQMDPK